MPKNTEKQEIPVEETVEETVKEKVEVSEPEKMVQIRIPRTRDDDSPTVFVSVNERTFMIEKGKTVTVPECVAEVLMHKEEMEEIAYEFEQAASHK